MCIFINNIKSLNETAHDILKNKLNRILPKFLENKKEKRGIFATLISGFIDIAYEGISSFPHNRRHKALHKAVKVIDNQAKIQHNRLVYLGDSMVMYGIYNPETLENLMHTVHHMYNSTTEIGKLLA